MGYCFMKLRSGTVGMLLVHRLRAMADLINSQLEKFDEREGEALSDDSKKGKK